MSECQIGCITSDDEGRGYYCEECPERRKGDASPLVECNAMGIRHAAHTWDFGSGEEFTCPGDAEGRVPDAPVSDALTDVEWHELVAAAVEMSRKAQQEQQRAEEAEFHVEQLRDACDSAERSLERIEARAVELATERDAVLARIARAEQLIDSWEHDAPDLIEPVFIGRLRECLRRDPAPIRMRGDDG